MTLEEALEIKHREREGYTNYGPETIDEADKLLIEAGKRVQRGRDLRISVALILLEGETKK